MQSKNIACTNIVKNELKHEVIDRYLSKRSMPMMGTKTKSSEHIKLCLLIFVCHHHIATIEFTHIHLLLHN